MGDVEDLTPLLDVPAKYAGTRNRTERPMFSSTEVTDVLPRTPKHRRQPTSAARGRALIAAMAAGAAAAAAWVAVKPAPQSTTRTVLASDLSPLDDTTIIRGAQLVTVKPAANTAVLNEEFARGIAYATERAQREALLQRPQYALPTRGLFTSGFGYRWGALHDGIDVAGPVGTPVYAAADGVVKEAGYTNSGYGAWVLITHSDGTVTRYGHINSWTVQTGQRVMAGDQVATIGNRGNSTGPHLHFSVLAGGHNAIDPVPWLASHGVSLGGYSG